jgi:hypothetical protein
MAAPINVGDKIKLTGKFLAFTGQLTGSEGQSTWIVVACECELCKSGDFVATNERSIYADEPDMSQWRHFNRANVFKSGTLDARNCP